MAGARLKDIADSVGCSVAVVSHVLNGSHGNVSCSAGLSERIRRKAIELRYTPHWTSRSLRLRRTNTLGVYMPANAGAFRGAYEALILAGINDVCRERQIDILLITLPEDSGATECATKLAGRRMDGLVLLHVPETADWIKPLSDMHANCVAINYFGPGLIPAVNFDDRAATFLAVGELARMGHRRIGYVGALRIDAGVSTQRRLDGYTGGMRESGLHLDARWVFEARYPGGPSPDWRRLSSRELAQWFAERYAATAPQNRPTALVCHSDATASLMLAELRRVGVRCPEDISLVGLDDSPVCRELYPTLSTIRQPLTEMGARAARYVLDRFERRLADGTDAPVAPEPLETAKLVRGRRGRPPTALRAALAEEQRRRDAAQSAAAAAAPAEPPQKRRLFLYTKPEFILRDSIVPPTHA